MSTREDIKLFIKLPSWFMIATPLGTYNPDWAIVKQNDEKLYLVRETKNTKDDRQHIHSDKIFVKMEQSGRIFSCIVSERGIGSVVMVR